MTLTINFCNCFTKCAFFHREGLNNFIIFFHGRLTQFAILFRDRFTKSAINFWKIVDKKFAIFTRDRREMTKFSTFSDRLTKCAILFYNRSTKFMISFRDRLTKFAINFSTYLRKFVSLSARDLFSDDILKLTILFIDCLTKLLGFVSSAH